MPLHYTKRGTLDMRYSSSKAAVRQGYRGPSSSGGFSRGFSSGGFVTGIPLSSSSGLHYKKDGSLDMRYSSSKATVGQGFSVSSNSSYSRGFTSGGPSSAVPLSSSSGGLHYKKDGSLDMRYSSSKAVVGHGLSSSYSAASSVPRGLHYKKDGSLDMRYSTSKSFVTGSLLSGTKGLTLSSASELHPKTEIPATIPRKKDGTPDMRTRVAKQWVMQQAHIARANGILPNWVPKKKDGTLDATKPLSTMFCEVGFTASADVEPSAPSRREQYWVSRAVDEIFREMLKTERLEPQPLPPPAEVIHELVLSSRLQPQGCSQPGLLHGDLNIPEKVLKIEYPSLQFEDDASGTLGKGSFGVVLKAAWNGNKVAVKKLHLTQLTRKDKADFEKEICILASLGHHQNLVYLHGYCIDPPCIIMELVELGSLSFLLHYCEDPQVEVRMTDGRVKKKLLYGIANGMYQLHVARIIHGDLKPQNVLVTKDYTAKVTDFGLSTLRGKTSSNIRSTEVDEDDAPAAVGGTGGYMAPELLDSTSPPDFPVDVYSFGILLNEVASEEEPYLDQYANFAGRGPFGAANYARQGKRPTINKKLSPPPVESLVTRCWAPAPSRRPTFKEILVDIRDDKFLIPDTISI